MATGPKVAIVTGGASGMGLATCQALGQRPGWEIHILDMNSSQGEKAAAEISNSVFHQSDITNYDALGAVFKKIFLRHNRIDFVYANAGIAERTDQFYERHNTGIEPPPKPPGLKVVDICMTAAVTTCYLAQHYFRLSPEETRGDRALVVTASCGALYPAYGAPIYTATKHGALGMVRALTPYFWRDDRIRVNAVLPGTVRTNLHSEEAWKQFPDEYFTPVEQIVKAVLIFVDGKDESKPEIEIMKGQAIECCGTKMYYREQYPFCDDAMKAIMAATDTES